MVTGVSGVPVNEPASPPTTTSEPSPPSTLSVASAADQHVAAVEADPHLFLDHVGRAVVILVCGLVRRQHQDGAYVAAGTADEAVVAGATGRAVRAGSALEAVVALAAAEVVTTRAAADHVVARAATRPRRCRAPVSMLSSPAPPSMPESLPAPVTNRSLPDATGQAGHTRRELGGDEIAFDLLGRRVVDVGLALQEREPVIGLAAVGGERRQRLQCRTPPLTVGGDT